MKLHEKCRAFLLFTAPNKAISYVRLNRFKKMNPTSLAPFLLTKSSTTFAFNQFYDSLFVLYSS